MITKLDKVTGKQADIVTCDSCGEEIINRFGDWYTGLDKETNKRLDLHKACWKRLQEEK